MKTLLFNFDIFDDCSIKDKSKAEKLDALARYFLNLRTARVKQKSRLFSDTMNYEWRRQLLPELYLWLALLLFLKDVKDLQYLAVLQCLHQAGSDIINRRISLSLLGSFRESPSTL